jgi:hypothetical protein
MAEHVDAAVVERFRVACQQRGIATRQEFQRRYGIAPGMLSPADALTLVCEVEQLQIWLANGALATLPDEIHGIDDVLREYEQRERLIGLVKVIIDAVPWSLTVYDHTRQIVRVLTPLLGQHGNAA